MIFNFLPSQIMTAFRVHNEKRFTESLILNSIGEGRIVPSYKPLMYSMRIYIKIYVYIYTIYITIYISYTCIYVYNSIIHMFAKKI